MITPGDFNEYDVVGALIVWVALSVAAVVASGYWLARSIYRLIKGKGK